MEEVLENVKKLQSHKGVEGVLMVKDDGSIVYSTLQPEEAVKYATFARNMISNTSSELLNLYAGNSGEELALLRVRTVKHELMIAREREYLLVAVQAPLAN